MEPALVGKIALLFVLIAGSAFFSSSEAALFTLGLYRVRRLKSRNPTRYKAAQKLLREPTRLISTILTGNEFVNTCISVIGSVIVYDLFDKQVQREHLPWLAVALVLPFVLVFGEIIPKTFGMKHPEKVASIVAVPLDWFSWLITPVQILLTWTSDLQLTLLGQGHKKRAAVSEEMFRAMVDTGRQEGVLDAREQQLIHNVFRLDDIKVAQIVTLKGQASFLRANMTIEEAFQKFESDRFSRFPVLAGETDKDKVVGVLYLKDLLEAEALKPTDKIQNYIRPHLTVSPASNALELFVQFRMRKTHFAVVADETTGDLLGVATLEDVLEEIFGDIRDEHDVVEEGQKSKSS